MGLVCNTELQHDGEVVAKVGDKVTASALKSKGVDVDLMEEIGAVVDENDFVDTQPQTGIEVEASEEEAE